MKTRLLLLLSLAAMAFTATAQQPAINQQPAIAQQPAAAPFASPTRPPLPPGPLLNRAPQMAQWVISFKSAPAAPAASASPAAGTAVAGPPKADPRDYQVYVTKTGSTYHVQMVGGYFQRVDKWCLDGFQISVVPNAQLPLVSYGGQKDDLFMNFARTDFPSFEWVSAKNFMGVQKVSGFDCMIFRDHLREPQIFGGRPSHIKADVQAVIDLRSRLPLYLQVGDSLASYQYGSAPTVMLTPPPNIMETLAAWQARMAAAAPAPSPHP
jgi:hypothetical protein